VVLRLNIYQYQTISRTDFAIAYFLHDNIKMASRASRLVSSGIIEASSLRLPLRLQRPGIRLNPPVSQRFSNPFSTSIRRAATPAASYARKPAQATPAAPAIATTSSTAATPSVDSQSPIQDLKSGLADEPLILDEGERQVDWTRSFHGLSAQPFSKEAAEVLLAPIPFDDVECKPDGIIYLPEIKYRRILNRAFGPGGWGLAPRGETIVTSKSITREYALVAHGR
jgi:Mitochondrial genome maintenance MGM101